MSRKSTPQLNVEFVKSVGHYIELTTSLSGLMPYAVLYRDPAKFPHPGSDAISGLVTVIVLVRLTSPLPLLTANTGAGTALKARVRAPWRPP
ncbi:hypothetical protein ACUXQ2_005886 [Cupriavidus metallidurans]